MKRMLLLLCALLLLAAFASAEPAPDLTAQCTFRSKGARLRPSLLYDRSYHHAWETARKRNPSLEVTLPEGQLCSGVQIKWGKLNRDWVVEIEQDGEWVAVDGYQHDYLTTFSELPNVSRFRISAHQRIAAPLKINELVVLGQGDRPDDIQVWEPTYEKADLLLVVAHPDDEYVFMGGIIPYYGTEMGKRVLVSYITESTAERRTELLDGLWCCGQTHYPLVGRFYDRYTTSLKSAYQKVGEKKVKSYMIELFRHYRPEVVVTHDIKGEYGHGLHKICADIVLNALERSGDPNAERKSAEAYGLWDVPKCYLHLYPENRITLDWHKPLPTLGGRTACEVALEAFACHLSQQNTEYTVYMDGPYDSRQFGLYRSLVGEDEAGNDFFEHLPGSGPEHAD